MQMPLFMGKVARALLPARTRAALKRLIYGRFERIVQDTGGMLTPAVYARIHQCVLSAPDGDIIEIGGASGAGTISMALALLESGKRSKVISVEKMIGGSRDEFGGFEENLARYESNLDRWGVRDHVELFPHWLTYENGREVLDRVGSEEISLMMCDADGLLHRDFELFWPRLRTGAVIIVDDYHPSLTVKHAITQHLLDQLEKWGLFEREAIIGETVFGRKPEGGDIRALDREACDARVQEIQREFAAGN